MTVKRVAVKDIPASSHDTKGLQNFKMYVMTNERNDQKVPESDELNTSGMEPVSMKKQLFDLASQSNVHGVSFLVSDKPVFLKLMWLVAFLGVAGFAIYQVYTIGMIFYSYPVKTKVKVEFKPLPFPAITICNMNIIRKSSIGSLESQTLKELLKGPVITDYVYGDYDIYAYDYDYELTMDVPDSNSSDISNTSTSSETKSVQSSTDASTYEYFWDYWNYGTEVVDYWDLDSVGTDILSDSILLPIFEGEYEKFLKEYLKINRTSKKEVGHQLNNMLLDCQFNGRRCDVKIKDVVTYEYGNCFAIQSPKFIAASTGPRSGMTLTINLENQEAIKDLTEGYGMRLVIHEQKTFPLPMEEGMTISGGYETSIGLKMSRIERKEHPYGTCIDTKGYFEKHGIRYTTQACIQQCWENMAMQTCGCQVGNVHSEISRFHDHFDNENGTDLEEGCFDDSEKNCSLTVRRRLLKAVEKYCNCPQPCLENVYSTTFSGRIWPHNTTLNKLKEQACEQYKEVECPLNQLSQDELKTNFLKINIYFEDLNYEIISEEPLYDATQVISDVGGSVGLCLGASFLCACEVIEALVMIIVVLLRKMRGNTIEATTSSKQNLTVEKGTMRTPHY